MGGGSGGTRLEAHNGESSVRRPCFCVLHQRGPDTLPSVIPVNHQSPDYHESARLNLFCDRDVNPSDWVAVEFSNPEPLIAL